MKKRDFTKGNIKKNLLYMSVPTMMGFFAQTLYDIVDMMWIGRISFEALAGVTIFSTIFWVVEVLNEIIGSSSVSLISQSYGEGDVKKTKECIEQTITFKALMALVAAVFLLLALKPLALFFDDNERVFQSVISYGYLRIFFIPIMFSSFTVNTALRCIGDSKRPLYLMLTSAVLNIILDPILMFDRLNINFWIFDFAIRGFDLGVFGAALATVISMSVAFALGFYFLVSGKSNVKISIKGLFKLVPSIDYKLMTIGLPNGAETLTRHLGNFVVLKIIASYGSIAIATAGIGMRFLGLLFMPLLGLMLGGGAIVGQNIGVGKMDRANKTALSAVQLGVVFAVSVSIVTFVFRSGIMKLFTTESAIIEMGGPMLIVFSSGTILIAYIFGISTVFSGSGYNFPFLVSSIVGRWIFALPFAIISVYILNANIMWVWVSFIIGDLAECFVIHRFYIKGKWKEKRVV